MTAEEERAAVGQLLTDDGRDAFARRSEDERRIITWLLCQDQDMPWRAEDIAEMILRGEHLKQEKPDVQQG